MKSFAAATVLLGIVFAGFVIAEEVTTAEKENPLKDVKCPISGKPISETKTVAFKDAKVYMCCGNCVKAFEKDAAKFATKANHQLVATKQFKQAVCPISGGDLNDEAKVKVVGVGVAFCCEKCQGKVAGMEEKEQVEFVFGDKTFKKAFKTAKVEEDKKAA